MTQLFKSDDAEVFHCDWQSLATGCGNFDALIVDAPYSEKTHSGHDKASSEAPKGYSFDRLRYSAWSRDNVFAFVEAMEPLTQGWFVSITDHNLAPMWESALEKSGRAVFSPIACVEPGSRVRMMGDGPSQWSCWAVVARPRNAAFSKWGALPGAYVVPPGHNPRPTNGGKQVVGGKPLWLMEALVRDYSRPGDTVCDPCCGAGTTGTAALRAGRRFIGCDALEAHAKLAAKALSLPIQKPLVLPMPGETVQQPITFQDP